MARRVSLCGTDRGQPGEEVWLEEHDLFPTDAPPRPLRPREPDHEPGGHPGGVAPFHAPGEESNPADAGTRACDLQGFPSLRRPPCCCCCWMPPVVVVLRRRRLRFMLAAHRATRAGGHASRRRRDTRTPAARIVVLWRASPRIHEAYAAMWKQRVLMPPTSGARRVLRVGKTRLSAALGTGAPGAAIARSAVASSWRCRRAAAPCVHCDSLANVRSAGDLPQAPEGRYAGGGLDHTWDKDDDGILLSTAARRAASSERRRSRFARSIHSEPTLDFAELTEALFLSRDWVASVLNGSLETVDEFIGWGTRARLAFPPGVKRRPRLTPQAVSETAAASASRPSL
jgi:hypothetical protein